MTLDLKKMHNEKSATAQSHERFAEGHETV